jgi:hypothetical protein
MVAGYFKAIVLLKNQGSADFCAPTISMSTGSGAALLMANR